jgi:MFS family permease
MLLWALLGDVVPIYALYAVLFAESGLSAGGISLLFATWSVVGVVAEVPTGVLADRFPRHWSLISGAVLQAGAYALWTAAPTFVGFAVGFIVWGIGGAFVSGASEALLYDGLAAADAEDAFADLLGRVRAAGLLAQVPAALAATVLFLLGGFALVGWVSVGACLVTAAVAATVRPPASDLGSAEDDDGPGLRAAVRELRAAPVLRLAVLGLALLTGLDAFEEYVPLLAEAWTVPVAAIPVLVLGLPVAGALGARIGGAQTPPTGRSLGVRLGLAAVVLLLACLLRLPVGLLGMFGFYAGYQAVAVAAGARLQQLISGRSRATVTSVAALASEGTAFLTYAAWALGAGPGVAILVLLTALILPRCFPRDAAQPVRTAV